MPSRLVVRALVFPLLAAAAIRVAAAQVPVTEAPAAAPSCAGQRPLVAKDSVGRPRTIPHCLARVEVFGDGNVKDVLG